VLYVATGGGGGWGGEWGITRQGCKAVTGACVTMQWAGRLQRHAAQVITFTPPRQGNVECGGEFVTI